MRIIRPRKLVCLPILVAVAFALFMCPPSLADDGYSLMIQQSPPAGGIVTPGSGVHSIGLDERVVLSAIPQPGYQFMYWLGDVSDAAGTETTIVVNGPKLVVAVFEKADFEMLAKSDVARGGAGSGGLTPTGRTVGSSGGISGGSYSPSYPRPITPDTPSDDDEVDDDGDFPVPDDSEVPEPATLALLGMGSVAIMKRRRTKK